MVLLVLVFDIELICVEVINVVLGLEFDVFSF